ELPRRHQASQPTRPVATSWIAPATSSSPASTSSRMSGLRSVTADMASRTFASATFRTWTGSLASGWPAAITASSAGRILSSMPVMLPIFTPAMALLMAPHEVWPKMTTAFAPATFVAYSRLPRMSALMKFPAIRAQNTSPMRWSKTSSGGTRESMQPTIAAIGDCPPAVWCTWDMRSQLTGVPSTKRRLPSFSLSIASPGVIADCRSGVKTSQPSVAPKAGRATREAPTAQAQNDRRDSFMGQSSGFGYAGLQPVHDPVFRRCMPRLIKARLRAAAQRTRPPAGACSRSACDAAEARGGLQGPLGRDVALFKFNTWAYVSSQPVCDRRETGGLVVIKAFVKDGDRLRVADFAAQRDAVIWVDLLQPSQEEQKAVEDWLGIAVPTFEEMHEIEISSRLYSDNDASFMIATLPAHSDSERPEMGPVSFVLAKGRLVT